MGKVLDSLLNKYLSKHFTLHAAQLALRPNLSTEAGIPCVNHTVK